MQTQRFVNKPQVHVHFLSHVTTHVCDTDAAKHTKRPQTPPDGGKGIKTMKPRQNGQQIADGIVNRTERFRERLDSVLVTTGSGNSLAANRGQAITWINDDPVLWRYMASLGSGELRRMEIMAVNGLVPNRVPGGRLNKKDGLTRYGNSHVKDKTS